MTPAEQQRVRVLLAEWAGFVNLYDGMNTLCGLLPEIGYHAVPDYASDLNAIHALEGRLTDEEWARYENILGVELGVNCEDVTSNWPAVYYTHADVRRFIGASAETKAAALVKAL